MFESLEWVQTTASVLVGVFALMKYFVSQIKEDIKEVRGLTVRAHKRIDSHLQAHSDH